MLHISFIVSALLFLRTSAQSYFDCFQPGECIQSPYLQLTSAKSPEECLATCAVSLISHFLMRVYFRCFSSQNITDCRYFTHYASDDTCYCWYDCVRASYDSCADCVSGKDDCFNVTAGCGYNGVYAGEEVDVSDQEDVLACANHCAVFSGCGYYTFDTDKGECTLTADRGEVVGCNACYRGEKICGSFTEGRGFR